MADVVIEPSMSRVVSDETKRKMSEAHKRRWADRERTHKNLMRGR